MNWNIVAIIVTVGLAQTALTIGLMDRLFRAEVRLLQQAIEGLSLQIAQLVQSRREQDAWNRAIESRVQRIEDVLAPCLKEGCKRTAEGS